MKVYTIRHKPTGECMPARMSRSSSRGWSYWREPNDIPFDKSPRIFFTLQSARNALTMWMQGTWATHMTGGSYFEPPEETCPAPHTPETPRVREDMEIVELELTGL